MTTACAAVAQPANRSGRPDRFFHFLIGYLAPTLHAVADFSLDGPLGVRSVGELDRLWAECRVPAVEVLAETAFDEVSACTPVHLAARGFDSPHAHAMAPWPAVRRSVLAALGMELTDDDASQGRRILLVERAAASTGASELGARSGADRRSVPNVADVAAALRAIGDLRVQAMEGLTLSEQIRLFREADIVVAQHGAALANMLWTRPGTRLVEIVTPEKANVLGNFLDALRVDVVQVAQADGHAPVDIAEIVEAAEAPEERPRSGRRKAGRTPIPWSARAWKRHEELAVDELDSERWLEQVQRWPQLVERSTESPVLALASSWRAGSTLLQRLLMSGGEAMIWGEPFGQRDPVRQMTDMFLPFRDAYPRPDHFLGQRQATADFDPSGAWVANLYPDITDLQRAQRAFIDQLLAAPARASGYTRWGLKEVRIDAMQAAYLQILYPAARLVFLVRNPYDAYRSYRVRGGWYDRFPDRPVFDPESFGRHWRRLTEGFLAHAEPLGAMLVRFEEMTGDPGFADRLAVHTGLRIDPGVLQVKRRGKEEAVPTPIRPKEIRSLAAIVGDLATQLGYPTPAE